MAICLTLIALTSTADAQGALANAMCQEVASKSNDRTPIRAGASLVLQEVICDADTGAARLTYRYIFEEINNQAADNRAGKKIGRSFQKRFCDKDENLHKVLELVNVRVTLENATGGPMGTHEFGLTDC